MLNIITEKQIPRAETKSGYINTETMNYVQESDYHTEESKKTFNQESFKKDENEMLNQDEKLK